MNKSRSWRYECCSSWLQWKIHMYIKRKIQPLSLKDFCWDSLIGNDFFLYFKHFQLARKLEHEQDLNHSVATLLLSFYQNIIGFKIIMRFFTKLMNSRKVLLQEYTCLLQCLLSMSSSSVLAELKHRLLPNMQESFKVRSLKQNIPQMLDNTDKF